MQRTVRLARVMVAWMLILALGAVAVGAQGSVQTVTDPSGTFSMALPQGWVTEPVTANGFVSAFAFGSSKPSADFVTALMSGRQAPFAAGIGGLIGEADLRMAAGQAPSLVAQPVMQALVTSITGNQAEIIEPSAPHKFGAYDGFLTFTNVGYVGVLYNDQHLLVVMIISDNPTGDKADMAALLDGITIGAGTTPVQPAQPTAVSPVQPVNPEVTPGAAETWRSSDNRLSVDLPADWNILDNVADANTMAYGDTIEAAQSRLASARPDLADKQPISGSGGLVILYPAAQFGIDAQNPDLSALMTQALAQLKTQGYKTDAATALENIPGGLYATIEGDEVGYLALIPFGDQIAYVTATGTQDTFDASEATLTAILESVQSPAAPEKSGLGGLGGLQMPTSQAPATTVPAPNETPEV